MSIYRESHSGKNPELLNPEQSLKWDIRSSLHLAAGNKDT